MDGHMTDDDSSMMMDSSSFCSGSGMVMLQGFQRATESSVNCVLFLFEDAAVDTKTKYAFAVIGAFLIAFSTEMIRYGRQMLARSGTKSVGLDLVKVGAYAVQMLLAYFLMLLVMLYEYVFLIAIIVGLSTGHFITLRLVATRKASSGGKDIPDVVAMSSSTPCCDNTTAIA